MIKQNHEPTHAHTCNYINRKMEEKEGTAQVHTSITRDVNHFLGKCLLKCSSTMASRGQNSLRAFSIAVTLDGNTMTF